MERGHNNTRSHGMNEREDYVPIDIQEDSDIPLFDSMREMIDDLPPLSNDCCIYRVPKRMREINEDAYTPGEVSIGPFHRGKEHLQAMEEFKPRYFQSFLNRTDRMTLKSCIRVAKEWEERARSYYAEGIKLSSDEFVKMVLLDSSFIIEVIWRFNFCNDKNTSYLDRKISLSNVQQDMILIENRLPFFILEGLFDLVFPPSQGSSSLLHLSIDFFAGSGVILSDMNESISSSGVKHFVDMLRLCYLPSSPRQAYQVKNVQIPTVTELHGAGMKFKGSISNRKLDIRHATGVLEIPQLIVSDSTESLFRNLIAFEQFHYQYDSYIIDYIQFMDGLIDTAKDAELLIQNGILDSYLSDCSAVATLFNNLTKEMTLWTPNYFYYGISEKLNEYCRDPKHKWRATLTRDYFSTPWKTASTIAAVILLGLTLIQTICSIVSL
ncbi:putative UPF0481 protein At3g02645 [Cornus florida]|uniref:putative UPF0481 protein At3g02645 n=1 Tax=Cornus florida TaxID=4283 RepID=UPI002897FA04|nr:putative UPF0481 protein At3g02645 [Cornus florida]